MLNITPKYQTLRSADEHAFNGYVLSEYLLHALDYNGSLKPDVQLSDVLKDIRSKFDNLEFRSPLSTWFVISETPAVPNVPQGFVDNAMKTTARVSGMTDEAYNNVVAAKARAEYKKYIKNSVRNSYPRKFMDKMTDEQYEAYIESVTNKTLNGVAIASVSTNQKVDSQSIAKQGSGQSNPLSLEKSDTKDLNGLQQMAEVPSEEPKPGEDGKAVALPSKFSWLIAYLTLQFRQINDYIHRDATGTLVLANQELRTKVAIAHAKEDAEMKASYIATFGSKDAKVQNVIFAKQDAPKTEAGIIAFVENKVRACTAALKGVDIEADDAEMLNCIIIPENAKLEEVLNPIEVADTDSLALKSKKRAVSNLASEMKKVLGFGVLGFTVFWALSKFFPSWNDAISGLIQKAKGAAQSIVNFVKDIVDGRKDRALARSKMRSIDPDVRFKVSGGAVTVDGVGEIMEATLDGRRYADITVSSEAIDDLIKNLPSRYRAQVVTLAPEKTQFVIFNGDELFMTGAVYDGYADVTVIRS